MKVDNYPEEKMSYGTKFSDNILDDPKYLYVGNNSKLILLNWFMFPHYGTMNSLLFQREF